MSPAAAVQNVTPLHDEVQNAQERCEYHHHDRGNPDKGRLHSNWSRLYSFAADLQSEIAIANGGGVPAGSAFSAMQAAAMGGPGVSAAVVTTVVPSGMLPSSLEHHDHTL